MIDFTQLKLEIAFKNCNIYTVKWSSRDSLVVLYQLHSLYKEPSMPVNASNFIERKSSILVNKYLGTNANLCCKILNFCK